MVTECELYWNMEINSNKIFQTHLESRICLSVCLSIVASGCKSGQRSRTQFVIKHCKNTDLHDLLVYTSPYVVVHVVFEMFIATSNTHRLRRKSIHKCKMSRCQIKRSALIWVYLGLLGSSETILYVLQKIPLVQVVPFLTKFSL